MAKTITQTQTVNVTIVDTENYETVLKIDNPIDGLTMSSVRSAFQGVIDGNYLYSKNNNKIASVARAQIVKIITDKTDLE